MIPADQPFWTKIVSPSLREHLVPASTIGVSPLFVEDIPLVDCGDFVWALSCISRYAPADVLAGYAVERPPHTPVLRERLLAAALEATDFWNFPGGALIRLFRRLKRNIDEASVAREREAHEKALDRIEDIILYTVEKHPNYQDIKRLEVQVLQTQAAHPASRQRPRGKRPGHLRLVQD